MMKMPMNMPINQNMYTGKNLIPNLNFSSEDGGENIKVCVRVRPLNMTELGRNDSKCVECVSSNTILLKNKNISKNYTYNIVFGEGAAQDDIFHSCSVNVKYFLEYFDQNFYTRALLTMCLMAILLQFSHTDKQAEARHILLWEEMMP